jgi:hypothetical protein
MFEFLRWLFKAYYRIHFGCAFLIFVMGTVWLAMDLIKAVIDERIHQALQTFLFFALFLGVLLFIWWVRFDVLEANRRRDERRRREASRAREKSDDEPQLPPESPQS